MARNTDSRFRQNIQFDATGIIGYSTGYPVFRETYLHIVTESLNPTNKIIVQAKLEDATSWVDIGTLTGNEAQIIELHEYDFVRFNCSIFSSPSLGILRGSGFFADRFVENADDARVDPLNSTNVPLLTGTSFTGVWQERTTPTMIMAGASDKNFTWVAQFANSLEDIEAGNIDSTLPYSYTAAAINVPRRLTIARAFYKIEITNTAGVDMSYLRFQTSVGNFPEIASKLNASLALDADANVTRSVIAGELLDSDLMATGLYGNVELTEDKSLKVSQPRKTIFQFVVPPSSALPSGSLPTIDRVLNVGANIVDSGWLHVRAFSVQSFSSITNTSLKVFLLNASDDQGNNWFGNTAPFLTTVVDQPANISARFFDDYFRIVIVNDSGSPLTEGSIRSRASNLTSQAIDISLNQNIFGYFSAPLNQSVIKGRNDSTLLYEPVGLSPSNSIKVAVTDRPSEVRNRTYVTISIAGTSISATPLVIYTVTPTKKLYITSIITSTLNDQNAQGQWSLRDNGVRIYNTLISNKAVGASSSTAFASPSLPEPIRVNTNLQAVEISGDIIVAIMIVGYEE